MINIKKSISLKASPSTVYQYLCEPKHMPEWLANMEEIRNIKGKGVGQTYEWTYRMAGVPLKGESKLIEDVPNKLRKTQTKGGAVSTWIFEMVPEGKLTKLNLSISYEIPVPVLGKLAEKLVKRRNERDAQTSIENFKDVVEAEELKHQHAAE